VESSEKQIRVYPQDGLRKRLNFVPHKIDLKVSQGEIDWADLNNSGKRLELSLSDSTGVVKDVKFELKGLPSGDYIIRYGGLARQTRISDSLRLVLPITDAKMIGIEMV
jgi:hypothetical protein